MNDRTARLARLLGLLSILLGLAAVVAGSMRGEGLLGPGWIGVGIGLVVLVITRPPRSAP